MNKIQFQQAAQEPFVERGIYAASLSLAEGTLERRERRAPVQVNLSLAQFRRASLKFSAPLALLLLALSLLCPGCSTTRTEQPIAATQTKNPQVVASRGMVATAHPLASQAGLQMLKAGGNAVDAAVAAAFAVGVAEPNDSGIGGEGVILIYRADTRQVTAIDYRSVAPTKASYSGRIPASGHAAVAVPGAVAGLCAALEQHGTMKLPRVLAPAIRIAEEGFTVSPKLAAIIADSFGELSKNEAAAALLCPQGLPLEAGATLRNPDLARTLRKIAAAGPDAFYHGEISAAISAEMAAGGGFVSAADLAAYRAVTREPVRGSYRGCELVSAPAPVGGPAVIEILQILEHFNLATNAPLSPANIHLMAEAMKRGFADQSAMVADPAFVNVPLDEMLSPERAKARAEEIHTDQVTPKVSALEFDRNRSGNTTSLCVVDEKGNVVVLTQTLSDHFGAKVLVPGTGILLNNEMKNFSTRGINALAPGKRMRGTLAPTILFKDGKPYAAVGTPGAARIITTMVILISNLLDHRMGIQEAIESPRFFARDTEAALAVEARVPKPTIEALTQLGYTIQTLNDYDLFFGGAQGIVIHPRNGKLIGGADPRRDGVVVGY